MKILIMLSVMFIAIDSIMLDGQLFTTFALFFSGMKTPVIVILYIGSVYFAFIMIGLMFRSLKELPLPIVGDGNNDTPVLPHSTPPGDASQPVPKKFLKK